MVVGLGADLVEIRRIRRLLEGYGAKALGRLFTEEELTYALEREDPAPSLAARFAAKEAFQKCWPERVGWKQVWVGMEGARPVLRFAEGLRARLEAEGLEAQLTLSHERAYALAVVILQRRG